MTNSIASSKCLPPVLTSGNYGMSQNRHFNESKEYIFVKLTDSAYRAVEEYQRNENSKRFSNGQCAKIQLVGNSGIIQFPIPDNVECRKFGFTIDDIEGSLECIQQAQNELDVLGSLPLRMRIHANDDVYDTTRTKMAIAEETEKSKCIREIKPNQTDIGRKVKKQASTSSIYNGNGCYSRDMSGSSSSNHATSSTSSSFLSNNNNRSKLASSTNNVSPSTNGNVIGSISNIGISSSKHVPSRSPNPALLGGSTTTGNNHGINSRYNSSHNNNTSHLHCNKASSSSSLPSLNIIPSHYSAGLHQTHSSSCTNDYSLSVSSPESNSKAGRINLGSVRASVRSPVGGGNGNGFQGNKSSAVGGNSKLPDISKRKLRERLIHLLALKPFKKPELYARLSNEGLRDKDRLSISATLKDIATLSRDNTYNLKRPLWNDVNENWPFYSEQELQQLKRRKPQNLTPPLSSDAGSSTSGHSPTSVVPSSPPPQGVSGSLKRASLDCDSYDNEGCGVQPKKQRISHFKKDSAMTMTAGAIRGTNGRLSYGNNSKYGQQNSGRNSTVSYSPLSIGAVDHNSPNNNNTDLSYSVLDNVDDFITRVDHRSTGSNYFNDSSRKNSINSFKEKHSSASSIQQYERSGKELMMKRKSSVSSPKTKTNTSLYAGKFISEKVSNIRVSGINNYPGQSTNGNNSTCNQPQQQKQLQKHHYKTYNSVIFSSQTQKSLQNEGNSNGKNISSGTISNYNNCNEINGNSSKRYHQHETKSCRTSSQSRTPTPPQQQQTLYQQSYPSSNHQHQPQQLQQQSQHYQSSSPRHQNVQPQSHSLHLQQEQHQGQQKEELHSSPTQQIAAAASSYSTATAAQPSQQYYDFSNYTRITSIEQRRQYKTEFENDYDEYRKLLAQIEGVSLRFRGLAERLENASKGCPDYYNIKQQIVSEYERIRNEEALQREKQRFDYLHEKLAHIKQLVTEYDKTLTSTSALQHQQQHAISLQQQQQQKHKQTSIVDNIDSCSQQSLMVDQANHSNYGLGRNSRLSPMVGGNSPQYLLQQHQHQLHHDAETIQQLHPRIQHDQQQQNIAPYNDHAPAQASPADTDTDDSSDTSGDGEDYNDDSNDASSQGGVANADDGDDDDNDDDDDDEDDDDDDVNNESY